MAERRALLPFAALSASYFAHIGFFNPYLPLWLKDLGLWLELSPLWLGVVLFLMFTHTSAMMPMSEAAMAHLVSQGGAFDAKRYGRVRLWGSIGFLVTVFAAGAWFEAFGMHQFPSMTVLSLLAVLASVWWLPDFKEAAHAEQARPAVWPVLRQAPVRWFFASAFCHVFSHIGIYVFFSLYLDALGYSKTLIGLMWAVSVVVEIAWFFWQSRWLHRHLGRAAVGAGAGAGAARAHLCRAPHGLRGHGLAPFPGPPARARPGALHRDRLRLSGRARRPLGRPDQRTLWSGHGVLGLGAHERAGHAGQLESLAPPPPCKP